MLKRIETLPGEAKAIVLALEAKNKDLYMHSVQTAIIAVELASRVFNNGDSQSLRNEDIFLAGLIHDVGKLYISDSILSKDSSLTERETETMRFHPIWGYQYLLRIGTLQHLAPYAKHHHESPDGTGYPDKLKVDDIPPVTRIIHIADRFSAMVSKRPYRNAFTAEATVGILQKDIDIMFPKSSHLVVHSLLNTSVEYLKWSHSCI